MAGEPPTPRSTEAEADATPTETRTAPRPTPPLTADGWIGRRVRDYEVLSLLGRGGMGLVFQARHVRLDRLVAFKILPVERFTDPAAIARFEREIKAVGRLEHPNIVQARDAGEADGAYFLVMELLEGLDLLTLLRRRGPFPVDLACESVRQAALGLQHVHDAGMVHRDLKLSNLFLTRSGTIKVLDLGLALLGDDASREGLTADDQVLGTFDYTAPEQWNHSHRVDIRADLYSLGCTLYTLLVGEPPFGGSTHPTVPSKMRAHLHETPTPVRGRRPEVPEELAEVLDRLLAKNPADRFATPRELVEALTPFCAGAHLIGLFDAEPTPEPEPTPEIEEPTGPPPATTVPDTPATTEEQPRSIVDEDVQFTVYRPRLVAPLRWVPMLVFTHLATKPADAPADAPDPLEEVERQAEQVLGPSRAREYQSTTQDSSQAVPRDEVISLVPLIEGVEFNPPQREFRWTETVHREEFRLRALAGLHGKTARGRLSVYLGSILLAEVPLSLKVDNSHVEPADVPPEKTSARPFRRIFASFASTDKPIVAQFSRFARMMGDEYHSRLTALRAGDSWDDRLRELIDGADVFQLFWSRKAIHSAQVEREWRYALSLNRPHFLRPVYWEDPLPSDPARDLPPEALKRLHFQKLGPPVAIRQKLARVRGPRCESDLTANKRAASGVDLDRPDDAGIDLKSVGGLGIPDALSIELAPLDAADTEAASAKSNEPEKNLFSDSGFEINAPDSSHPEDQGFQLDLASDFYLEDDSESGSHVFALDEEDFGQDAEFATAAAVLDARDQGSGSSVTGPSREAPGAIVLGRYRLERRLASGAMGDLWLAHDSQLDRKVVARVLGGGPMSDASFARLKREFGRIARTSPPQAAALIDFTRDTHGRAYLVSEHVEGQNLAELIRSGEALDPPRVGSILAGLCQALQAAHDRGLVHGGLRPTDIVITPNGSVRLLELGVTRLASTPDNEMLTAASAVPGSVGYMAPEQVSGDSTAIGPATDLYAVGLIAYELLSGRQPFTGPALKILRDQLEAPPPPFAAHNLAVAVPPAVERVVFRCLAKNPRDRPASAQALSRAFAQAIAPPAPMASPALAPPSVGWAQPSPDQASRRRSTWVAGWIVLALAALAVALWLWLG
jgi:serine/threonine protein kinase